MSDKEFRYDAVVGFDIEQHGDTLYIKGANFLSKDIDYTDEKSMKRLATKANSTADGLYDLITKNCNIIKPSLSPKSHLEMYLSLAGLACEIYLKSLIYYEFKNDGAIIRQHNFEKLFRRLSQDKQQVIRNAIANIDELLPRLSILFPCLRYDYECNHIQGEYLAIFDFMNELKSISNQNPPVLTGAIRCANGELMLI